MGVTERGGPQHIPRPPGTRAGGPPPWAAVVGDDRRLTLDGIRAALAAKGPGKPVTFERVTPRASAVLVPLFEEEGEVHVVLTRRSQHLRWHRGEVSFPGGGQEDDESLVETALRESQEEIGLDPDAVEIIGELDHLTTISSRSFIVPYVGALAGRPDLTPNPNEVDHVLFVPLSELLLEEVYREELWGIGPINRSIYFFELVGDTVWGATAHMLHEFLDAVIGRTTPPAPER